MSVATVTSPLGKLANVQSTVPAASSETAPADAVTRSPTSSFVTARLLYGPVPGVKFCRAAALAERRGLFAA